MRKLGQNVSRVVERIKRGEVLIVTEFGHPVAKIMPVHQPRSRQEALEMGLITPAQSDWRDLLNHELLAPGDGETLSEILQRMRDDER